MADFWDDAQCPFSHKVVRDLWWLLFSPGLFSNIPGSSVEFCNDLLPHSDQKHDLEILAHLDTHPSLLPISLRNSSQKLLGLYVEDLLAFWIDYSPLYTLVARNVPVKGKKGALGEIDFLFWAKRGESHIHLECAIKFYLAFHNTKDWENFLGPNPKDRLADKMYKLTRVQSQWSEKEEGKSILSHYGIDQVEKHIFLKGSLFYPANIENPVLAENSRKDHVKRRWYYASEWTETMKGSASQYIILQKKEWLMFHPAIQTKERLKNANVLFQLPLRRPLFISEIQKGKEIRRFFIVPNTWPKRFGEQIEPFL